MKPSIGRVVLVRLAVGTRGRPTAACPEFVVGIVTNVFDDGTINVRLLVDSSVLTYVYGEFGLRERDVLSYAAGEHLVEGDGFDQWRWPPRVE